MIERPAIVWFQEQVPFAAFDATLLAAIAADAILVIGTSGAVSPTAAFLHRARANGTRIIDINPEGSHVPATISLRGTAAVLLPVILQARRS
jgi:NAD-dependent deacetylase